MSGVDWLNAVIESSESRARGPLALVWNAPDGHGLVVSDKKAFEHDVQPMFKKLKKQLKQQRWDKSRIGKLDVVNGLRVRLFGLVLDDKKHCPIMHMLHIHATRGTPSGTSFWFFHKKDRDNYFSYLMSST